MKNQHELPRQTPVMPQRLLGSHKFAFSCYPGISCFNNCCRQADITLTPYDIVRLKRHLALDSAQFLTKYTVPFEMDADGMPGVKLRHKGESSNCVFMNEEGCSVYENRPTACRYYPVGQLSMREQDKYHDDIFYCLVAEDYCLGHKENHRQSIDEFRASQGLEKYDEMNRQWQRIILKRKSAGPAVGKPSPTSFQFYFMAMFDQDRFRKFINSASFAKTYEVDDALLKKLDADDEQLLVFAYKLLMQVLFGEENIKLRAGAVDARIKEREQIWVERRRAEEELHRQQQLKAQEMKD